MVSLSKCVECDGLVSSQAPQCPHCITQYPSGVKCSVCCEALKRSEAIKITKEYGGAENRVSVKFFHPSCHAQVNQIRAGRARTVCPACQRSIEFETSSSVICNHCGHQCFTKFENPSFASCCYCGFHLNKNLEVAVKEVNRQFLTGWVTETIYAHKICYTKQRQEQEEKSQKKELIDNEYIKKKRAKELRNQKAKRNRETLILSVASGLVIGAIVGGVGGAIFHLVWGFASSWRSAAFLGFGGVSVLTMIAVWLFSLVE
jgi:hypothetical protein